MKNFGLMLALTGVAAFLLAGFTTNSVETDALDMQRIINFSLMQRQLMMVLYGVAASISGSVLFAVGVLIERRQP